MPEWHGGVDSRKPSIAKVERKAESGPTRELTHPDVMVHLEALVDAQRRQRELQEQLRIVDTDGGKLAGQEVKRQVLAAQWKSAEETFHAAAERASQALGLGETAGRRVEVAPIPEPPMPRVDFRRVSAQSGARRRSSSHGEQEELAA